MSQATTRTSPPGTKTVHDPPPSKDLRGLMPYLRRYPGSIIFGLLMVVLMGIVGNVLPLATGVMTDTLAGNSVPFEHSTQSGTPVALALNASRLSRSIPYYAPSSLRTLGIYFLILVLCVAMIFAILVMVALSPSLTLWVLLPAPVVAVAVWFFGKTIHELYEKIQAALATLTARVQENLAGVRVVRAYAPEEAEIRSFDEPNREYVSRNIRLIRTWSMFMPSLTALIGTTFLIVLWQGGHQLLRGQISLGALIAFNGYLTLLVWPMIALGWVTNIFQRGAASMGRLNYILTAKPNIDDRNAKVPEGTKPRGEIEFRHLTFTYPTTLS